MIEQKLVSVSVAELLLKAKQVKPEVPLYRINRGVAEALASVVMDPETPLINEFEQVEPGLPLYRPKKRSK